MICPELSQDQITEMAVAVLRATDDGNGLAPVDLALIELAVNQRLDSSGLLRFAELHENATKPSGYMAPWLFGIEHLTVDHHRRILWKGVAVEHFDHAVWRRPGWRERMRADAEAVAARCRKLEATGIQPSMAAVIDW